MLHHWENLIAAILAAFSAGFALAGAIWESLIVLAIAVLIGSVAVVLKRYELRERERRERQSGRQTAEFRA